MDEQNEQDELSKRYITEEHRSDVERNLQKYIAVFNSMIYAGNHQALALLQLIKDATIPSEGALRMRRLRAERKEQKPLKPKVGSPEWRKEMDME